MDTHAGQQQTQDERERMTRSFPYLYQDGAPKNKVCRLLVESKEFGVLCTEVPSLAGAFAQFILTPTGESEETDELAFTQLDFIREGSRYSTERGISNLKLIETLIVAIESRIPAAPNSEETVARDRLDELRRSLAADRSPEGTPDRLQPLVGIEQALTNLTELLKDRFRERTSKREPDE